MGGGGEGEGVSDGAREPVTEREIVTAAVSVLLDVKVGEVVATAVSVPLADWEGDIVVETLSLSVWLGDADQELLSDGVLVAVGHTDNPTEEE
jgi:hypothetical protein